MIQEVTSFHLEGSQEVVRMTSLMVEDSVNKDSFHLPTWIKVQLQKFRNGSFELRQVLCEALKIS